MAVIDLSKSILKEITFENVEIENCNFNEVIFQDCKFKDVTFNHCNFNGAKIFDNKRKKRNYNLYQSESEDFFEIKNDGTDRKTRFVPITTLF